MIICKVHTRFLHFALGFRDIKVYFVDVTRLLCRVWGLEVCFQEVKADIFVWYLFWGVEVLNKTSNMRKSEELSMLSLLECSSAVLKSCHLEVTRCPLTQSGFLKDSCVLGWSNKIATCRKIDRTMFLVIILTSPVIGLGDPANYEGKKYWAVIVKTRKPICAENKLCQQFFWILALL